MCRDIYDGVREARPKDLRALLNLIRPLEADGTLVKRPREAIKRMCEAGEFYVVEREGTVMACATLKLFSGEPYKSTTADTLHDVIAEIGCIAVNQTARKAGNGNALVSFLLRKASLLVSRLPRPSGGVRFRR